MANLHGILPQEEKGGVGKSHIPTRPDFLKDIQKFDKSKVNSATNVRVIPADLPGIAPWGKPKTGTFKVICHFSYFHKYTST